jgi:hypothetical protein
VRTFYYIVASLIPDVAGLSLPRGLECGGRAVLFYVVDLVCGVRVRLWTAATHLPIVHPPGDIWAWRTMVEWYRQEKLRFVHQSFLAILPAESSSSTAGGTALWSNFFHASKSYLTCRNILRHGADGFTYPPKEKRAADFYPPYKTSPRPGLTQRILGPMASMITVTPPRTMCLVLLVGGVLRSCSTKEAGWEPSSRLTACWY